MSNIDYAKSTISYDSFEILQGQSGESSVDPDIAHWDAYFL